MKAEPAHPEAFAEERLVLELIRVWDSAADGPLDLATSPPDRRCDWQDFLRVVHRHRVAHPVREAIARLEQSGIPPNVVQALEQQALEVRSLNILLQDRLVRLARCLDTARVPFLVLKGLALQQLLYADLAARPSSDLDVLVRRADLERCLDALAAAGFRVPRGGERRFWVGWYHHIQLALGQGMAVSIEIHWDLELRERHPFPLEEMWERSIPFSLAGCQLRTLGREDHYVHAAVHLARHFHAPRLMWLMDLRRMARCWSLDWPRVAEHARRCGGRTALWFAAAYEERVFGTSLQPPGHRAALRSWQRMLLRPLEGVRPLEPLRDVASERRRIFATLLFFDRISDLLRFLAVHGRRKLMRWTGIEWLLRRRS